jgi:hypothetical protein
LDDSFLSATSGIEQTNYIAPRIIIKKIVENFFDAGLPKAKDFRYAIKEVNDVRRLHQAGL